MLVRLRPVRRRVADCADTLVALPSSPAMIAFAGDGFVGIAGDRCRFIKNKSAHSDSRPAEVFFPLMLKAKPR